MTPRGRRTVTREFREEESVRTIFPLRDSQGHAVPPIVVVFQVGMNEIVKQAHTGELPGRGGVGKRVRRIGTVHVDLILRSHLITESLQLQTILRPSQSEQDVDKFAEDAKPTGRRLLASLLNGR